MKSFVEGYRHDIVNLMPQLSESNLLLLACRTFLKDLIEIYRPGMASSIDFDSMEFFSDEGFDDMRHRDCRFEVDLAVRLRLSDKGYEEERQSQRRQYEEAKREQEEWDDDEDDDALQFDEDEDEDDEDDDEAYFMGRAKRYVLLHLVIVDEPYKNLGKDMQHHWAYHFVENRLTALSTLLHRSGGEPGPTQQTWSENAFGMETLRFTFPAMSLAEDRAEKWVDRVKINPLAAVFASRMGSSWNDEERERRLLEALGQAEHLNEGRRHFLECLVKGTPEAANILNEEETMATVDVAQFGELLREFFPDVLALIGGQCIEGLEFANYRFLDDEIVTRPSDPPDMEAALIELLAQVSKRGQPDKQVLLHVQLARDREGPADERTVRRYMQLKLEYPSVTVMSFIIFLGQSTGSGVNLCETRDRDGEEVINRFRFRAFTLAANSGEDYAEDPHPVAWALAALMGTWKWRPGTLKLECLSRILKADVTFKQRLLLWRFVQDHLHLQPDEEKRVRDEMKEHAEVMAETALGIFDARLGPIFTKEMRERFLGVDDPMKVHLLIDKIFDFCVEQEFIPPEDELDLPVH